MAAPLPRRFYEVLSKSVYNLIGWLIALLISLSMESAKFKSGYFQFSCTWFLMTLPLYAIVMFGCYAMIAIGYHMIILRKFIFQQKLTG